MGIAALGLAMAYLLVLAAGALGALLILVWLFGEAPGEGTGTEHETVERLSSTDRLGTASAPPASVGPERPKDEAA